MTPGGSTTSLGASRAPHHAVIDGLRGVAVLLVILNHIDVPGFSRGFLGVDMFFAISGYLITDRLVTNLDTGSTMKLRELWAGRARRILPAVGLVIVVTVVGAALFLAPQEMGRVGIYGGASTVFGLNILAPLRGGNYFEGPLRDSPFLHLWSLGVEEQFYLVWPLLLGPLPRLIPSAMRAMRLRRPSPTASIAATMGVVGVVSLGVSLWLTPRSPLWAFYGLPTRMFEFVLGGVASVFLVRYLPRRWRTPLAVGGTVAVVVSLVTTPVGAGFPAGWPLLSAGGTAAIMLGTAPPVRFTALARPLTVPPLTWFGRYSYSWYLWHWPALVLGLAATNDNRTAARILCVASLLPAMAAYHFVENPVRFARPLVASWRRSLLVGAAIALVSGAACAGLVVWGRHRLKDPQITEWNAAAESFGAADCTPNTTLLDAPICLGGSTAPGVPIVMLAGDSHAAQWVSAFSLAGRRAGFAVALRTLGNCPAAPPTESATSGATPSGRLSLGCIAYERETELLIGSGKVSVVVLAEATTSRDATGSPAEWQRRTAALLDVAVKSRTNVAVMVDNPNSHEALTCLSRGFSRDECRTPTREATVDIRRYSPAMQAFATQRSTAIFDLTPQMCARTECFLRTDGVWIPARANHLTRAFTHTQIPQITALMRSLIASAA